MSDPTFGGLVPTRLGYTITPAYSGATKEGRAERKAAHDAAASKQLRIPYFKFTHRDEASKSGAKVSATIAALKFTGATGYEWTVTECMF